MLIEAAVDQNNRHHATADRHFALLRVLNSKRIVTNLGKDHEVCGSKPHFE